MANFIDILLDENLFDFIDTSTVPHSWWYKLLRSPLTCFGCCFGCCMGHCYGPKITYYNCYLKDMLVKHESDLYNYVLRKYNLQFYVAYNDKLEMKCCTDDKYVDSTCCCFYDSTGTLLDNDNKNATSIMLYFMVP